MRCPNCGTVVGRNAPFCPQCGTDLGADNRRRRIFLRKIDRNVRHGTAAAVILMAIISVLVVVIAALPAGVEAPPKDTDPPDGAIILDDRTYIVLYDGFSSQGMAASLNESGELVLSVPGYKGDATKFEWEFRNDLAGTVFYITKSEPVLTWIAPSKEDRSKIIGDWTFIVACRGQDSTEVFTGSLTCYGDSVREYTWTHSGVSFSIGYTVSLQQYQEATGWVPGRTDGTLRAASAFVSADPTVSALEDRIWAVYSSALGGSRTSADYATCLASFVSTCFEEREDYISHGVSVYNASPVETLYRGYGDSCDMSVLLASLLKTAGIGSGLAKMPDMWVVGIAVRSSTPVTGPDIAIVEVTASDLRYWITSVTPFTGIGQVPDSYGYDGSGFTYHGSAVGDGYGFVACDGN